MLRNASSKSKALVRSISSSDDEVCSRNIKSLCPTRWLVRLPAIVAVLTQYGSILTTLAKACDACYSSREQLRIEYFRVLDVALLQLKERFSDTPLD